jgi:hypothetical protein
VQKALEVNDPKKKVENQITDETRNDPGSTGRTTDSKKGSQTGLLSQEILDAILFIPSLMVVYLGSIRNVHLE